MVEFLVTIAGGILEKALFLASSEVVLAWGYADKLAALRRTLELINAMLDDADKQKSRGAVMVWLKQLKDAVGEADDVLDEIHYENLRREVMKRNWMARKVSSFPSLKKLSFRIEMGHKIENVSQKLNEINNQANSLGLQNQQPSPVSDSLFRETDPYSDEYKVVGRENEELHIIQLLTQSRKEEKLTIVPIVGMGGIGKTTLAKSIYNNPTIQQHFDVKVWLCVSVKTQVDKLLAKIYESLAGEECKSQLRPNLIANLQNKLGSKRYFLVLDDTWDEESAYWDDFKSCMLKVNLQTGSSILVTTRNLEIGTKAMSEDFYALKSLPNDKCWSIFKERAFVAGRSPLPELEEIGHDIVRKCCGLPLLVKVIGGVLRNYNDKEKWLSIKDSNVWDMEEGVRVQNSLKLSFDNLPNSIVKQCFVQCSIFKKDKVMKREKLIRLWMALGLVQADERRNKGVEDVGNDIFQILVSSSLFQDVKMDEYGYVTCCMHDLVHDLSLSLSKHERLCLVGPTSDDFAHIPEVKHLAMLSQDQGISEATKISKEIISLIFKKTRTLHTLILKGHQVEKNVSFQSFKCMKILSLRRCGLKKIDDSIGELVHLKYLDLSYNYDIDVLPKSICKLYLLQTLMLRCYRLKKLPQEMSNLTSLRHLMYYKSFPGIPIRNVGRLTYLTTLPSFRLGQAKGYQIEELGPLKHLAGELLITDLENVSNKEDAAKADLSGKKKLSNIGFYWSEEKHANQNVADVLEGLQPPANVKSLTIKYFSGDNFPAWVAKMAIEIEGKWTPLHKLVKIELWGCNKCPYLPVLEYLPLLQDLVLGNMDNLISLSTSSSEGVNSSMKQLSPSMRSLKLVGMNRLVQWNIDATTNNSTMLSPVLESLFILNCPMIIHLNECHLHPLVSLFISGCKNLVSIESIQGLTSLKSLTIEYCPSLSEIPHLQDYKHHPLKSLKIIDCKELTSLPCKIFDCFPFLNVLELGRFSKEHRFFPSLQGIEKLRDHLRSLRLNGWSHWMSIPEEVQHLTSLTRLDISGFGMQELPMWLTNMSSIRAMSFVECKGLDEETIKQGAPREAKVYTDDFEKKFPHIYK